MRGHGVLNRILLLYEEGILLLESAAGDLRPAVLASAAGLVRSFIGDDHEKLDENHLFPRFAKVVAEVAAFERHLGIDDLAGFTPAR